MSGQRAVSGRGHGRRADEPRRAARRCVRAARRLALCLLVASTWAPATGAATRRGPPEGSPGWLSGQASLRRPASALAAAIDAWTRGDLRRADWLLAETAERHVIVADYAVRMRAELSLQMGLPAEAAAIAGHALDEYPDSPLVPAYAASLGHARAALRDEEGARVAWRRALDSAEDEAVRAALLLATARSLERSGRSSEAGETYAVLWTLYPLAEEAEQAAARLDELEATGAVEPRGAVAWRKRGDGLFRKRRNTLALAAYELALTQGLPATEARRAQQRRAQTFFRLRRYPEATAAFSKLPQKNDVPLWVARSRARSGDVLQAIREFEALSNAVRGSLGLRARFLAALLLEGRGQTDRARLHYRSLAGQDVSPGLRQASLWRLAWSAYRAGRYADAIAQLDRQLPHEDDPIGRLRPRYWRARALSKLDDDVSRSAAREALAALADEYPLSYYGWRARVHLARAGVAPPPPTRDPERAGDAEILRSQDDGRGEAGTEEASTPDVSAAGRPRARGALLPSRELERARILLEAGLPEEALDEIARIARRARSLDDRLDVAQLYSEAGSYRGAQRIVVDAYKEELARGPTPRLEELWWHAWPTAFGLEVEAATASPGSVDASLVFSIMREESGFRPAVVSPVGARGLLQIMEPTGERLARSVGLSSFTADDLFEPATNIRLGAHYLGELSGRFDGRLSAAIASYNAGPEVVSEWVAERRDDDDDEWVESIPYEQTRSYVKRVLRSLQAYRLLY